MIQKGPKLVVVLKDGIRGHENQSLGVAYWLAAQGSRVAEFSLPVLKGLRRFLKLKVGSLALAKGNEKLCRRWLSTGEAAGLLDEVEKLLTKEGLPAKEVLFISAGSSAAPYCLALARALGGRCCTIMTPSVLGIEPFDFAVVPEHDRPKANDKVILTFGAPNRMCPEVLEEGKKELLKRFPPRGSKAWGVLLGGDDKNYRISPLWVQEFMKELLFHAERENAELYITTSRRTSREAEKALMKLCEGSKRVNMLLLASRESWSPVAGMLGLCDRILCTEDSVSMISEAATSGHRPIVLPVERPSSLRSVLANFCLFLERVGLFKGGLLWGAPRFSRMIRSLEERGLCYVASSLEDFGRLLLDCSEVKRVEFNEAKRVAEWIAERWSS
jgi:hypothetical protein